MQIYTPLLQNELKCFMFWNAVIMNVKVYRIKEYLHGKVLSSSDRWYTVTNTIHKPSEAVTKNPKAFRRKTVV